MKMIAEDMIHSPPYKLSHDYSINLPPLHVDLTITARNHTGLFFSLVFHQGAHMDDSWVTVLVKIE